MTSASEVIPTTTVILKRVFTFPFPPVLANMFLPAAKLLASQVRGRTWSNGAERQSWPVETTLLPDEFYLACLKWTYNDFARQTSTVSDGGGGECELTFQSGSCRRAIAVTRSCAFVRGAALLIFNNARSSDRTMVDDTGVSARLSTQRGEI